MNKVGIFSARTPNRFVGFFLVVEVELNSVYLLPFGRLVGRLVVYLGIVVNTIDTVNTRTYYISFDRRLFRPLPLVLPPPTTNKRRRRREVGSIQIYKKRSYLSHSQLFIYLYCSSLSVYS